MIVVRGRSCIEEVLLQVEVKNDVEGIDVGIGEESYKVIGVVIGMENCEEGCRENNVRIGWKTDSLG